MVSSSRRRFLRTALASALAVRIRPFLDKYTIGLPKRELTAQGDHDILKREFVEPPKSARPSVWWHWMNGNITREGIRLDLEWMHRVGLGGVTISQISIRTPQVVKRRLVYMTPGWKGAFRYATSIAKSLGVKIGIDSSPGWAETGGPWVPPAQAMKKMVWSETHLEGGKPFTGTLSKPPDVSGTFQNYSVQNTNDEHKAKNAPPLPRFYADSAVVAYRVPPADRPQSELQPRISSSGSRVDVAALSDGDVQKVALSLPYARPGEDAWIQFEYPNQQMVQSVTLATLDDIASIFEFYDANAVYPRLEASDDGQTFRHVVAIPASSVPQRTVSFPAVKAKFFRVSFRGPESDTGGKPKNHLITELVLHRGARINQFEKRAGFSIVLNYYDISTPPVTTDSIVNRCDVIDLSGKMRADGYLDWTPPDGKWAVLRIGYSLTGAQNHPAPIEDTGLEVDKLNRKYVRNYVEGYLNTYESTVGSDMIGRNGISYMLTDSAEYGAQNWTDDMIAEFSNRRGYDAHQWLPALTGMVINSPEESDKFLWDFRRTIAELLAQNHYGEIAAALHNRGMEYHSEALEYHRPSLGDDMEMRRSADVPMGAMWTYLPDQMPLSTYIADLRGAASVAHVYGQNLVGAESMTSNGPAWGWAPNSLKRIADLEMALGVNKFMIHQSTHQPLVGKAPGLSLGHYGLWFDRNQTWAEQARPWINYLTRCSHLLQQGQFYADVAYFYGEEGPLTAVFGLHAPKDLPEGYGFDFVNADVVLNRLSYEDGRLVTPSGSNYGLLYLGGTSGKMTLPVLRKIRELVHRGAIIVGKKPLDSPSLADNLTEFRTIADQLWGHRDVEEARVQTFGKGKVYFGRSVNEVLDDLKLPRDFECLRPAPETELMFVHRKLSDSDIYFVVNRKNRTESIDVAFRVVGKTAEFWDPDTAETRPASTREVSGRTVTRLDLNPYETIFIMFRDIAVEARSAPSTVVETSLLDITGAWTVHFQSGRGAPESIMLDPLSSWSDNNDEGVRFFSGTATYTKVIHLKSEWFRSSARLWLDLGDVRELASLSVNGDEVGTAWKVPYRLDVTDFLRPGANILELNVTNLWVNRLIGDQQPHVARKYTFTTFKPYQADSPLLPSGLLGPVRLVSILRE